MTGWVRVNMIEPKYHFGFIGLDWIDPLPGEWMYLYFVVIHPLTWQRPSSCCGRVLT